MKNANVFVDVDLTLVDANGRILAGASEGLQQLKEAGCHLFLWSSCGAEYCRKVAEANGLAELFEGFSAKPDIVIDDMPGTCVAPFGYDARELGWEELAKRIVEKHVD
jgi:phosphoglycolate phosphatase-like HAD superfamily hydrolase